MVRGLGSVFAIKRIITTKYSTSEEISYYISSLLSSPQNLIEITREHWKIESMHWILDVVFAEDDSTILSENGLTSLNTFRKLALLLHKKFVGTQTKKQSYKNNMFDCLLNDNKLVSVIENL